LRLLVSQIEHSREVARDLHIAAGAFHARQTVERFTQSGAQSIGVGTGTCEQVPYPATFLVKQRQHQVRWLYKLVVSAQRQTLRIRQGQLEFRGQFIHSHKVITPMIGSRYCPVALVSARMFYPIKDGD
jgi:hypothetical protein